MFMTDSSTEQRPAFRALDADAKLDRNQTAAALTAEGFKTAPSSLATMATRGSGPPYKLYGRKPIYTWRDALAWARSRLSEPRRTTSEHQAPCSNTEAEIVATNSSSVPLRRPPPKVERSRKKRAA